MLVIILVLVCIDLASNLVLLILLPISLRHLDRFNNSIDRLQSTIDDSLEVFRQMAETLEQIKDREVM